MTYYVIANKYNGIIDHISNVIPEISADQTVIIRDGDIAELGSNIWNQAQNPTPRIVTKLEFMRRLTQNERVELYTAEKSDIHVSVWMDMFRLAQEINLDDPDLIQGLQLFELAGLITTGRSAEILV